MISRREFVNGMALAGAAGTLGFSPRLCAAEPALETTRIRFASGGLCAAPTHVAEELLRAEGFADIRYLGAEGQFEKGARGSDMTAAGEADFSFAFVTSLLQQIDQGRPLVIVCGGHAGCIEVFGARGIRNLRDLKGKVVATPVRGFGPSALLDLMFGYIGIDPNKDIEWRIEPRHEEAVRLLEEGKVQAYSASPPRSLEMRARGIGNVILNTTTDRPWSEHFCCMVGFNREYLRKNPVASRRALRAVLKSADLCAAEPERAARIIQKQHPKVKPEILLQAMKEVPYRSWRQMSPENTVRFYAIRMHELGIIKSDLKKLIAQATDWRMLNELKKELKT
jgi:NitT/TauT family transport system substrate-binding protein